MSSAFRIFLILSFALVSCGKDISRGTPEYRNEIVKKIYVMYENTDWTLRARAVRDVKGYIVQADSKRNLLSTENEISDRKIIEDLLVAASSDRHPAVRIEAVSGLEKLKTKASIARIREMALHDRNSNVRWAAYKSLAQSGDSGSLDIFIRGCQSGDWLIREASITGVLKSCGSKAREKALPSVLKSLQDNNVSVRLAALKNLSFRDSAILTVLKEGINDKKTTLSMRIEILRALVGYDLDDETRNTVINFLTHTNRDIRVLALRVLKSEKRNN